jgi:hypothetical protein
VIISIHLSKDEAAAVISALTREVRDVSPHGQFPAAHVVEAGRRVASDLHGGNATDGDSDQKVAFGELFWAAVCLRGHVQEAHIDLQTLSVLRGPVQFKAPQVPSFCGRCGGRVLLGCRSCGAGIAGQMAGHPRDLEWEPAGFCWKCGVPYPWATREQRLAQLYNVIDDEDLDDADRLAVLDQIALLSEPVDEVSDEDRVRAEERVRNFAPRVWEAALPILQSLLTAKAKKELGLPP